MTGKGENARFGFGIPQLRVNQVSRNDFNGFVITARDKELAVVNDKIVHPVRVRLDASLVTILAIPYLSLKSEWDVYIDLSVLSSHIQTVIRCAKALGFASNIADRFLAFSRYNIPYLH